MAIEPGLIVLAIVRRLLRDLGREPSPEEISQPTETIGLLERWIHEPRADLAGKTLVSAYAANPDEQLLRTAVADLLASGRLPGAGEPG